MQNFNYLELWVGTFEDDFSPIDESSKFTIKNLFDALKEALDSKYRVVNESKVNVSYCLDLVLDIPIAILNDIVHRKDLETTRYNINWAIDQCNEHACSLVYEFYLSPKIVWSWIGEIFSACEACNARHLIEDLFCRLPDLLTLITQEIKTSKINR